MTDSELIIVYDGKCPFCSSYVRLIRLRETIGSVRLLDAREQTVEVNALWEGGYDLDQGMAMIHNGRVLYGPDCLYGLALLSTPSGIFNRMNAMLLSHPAMSRAVYPLLKVGRTIALWLLGRGRLRRSNI